ncbi:MAG: glutaredoxin domain-containing protein [Fusobacteriaceae bacterium]
MLKIYTIVGCPYCSTATLALQKAGLSFTIVDAPGGSQNRLEANAKSGITTVPQIFKDELFMGDCTWLVNGGINLL